MLTGLGYIILVNVFNGIGETKETMMINLIITFTFLPVAPLMVKAFHVIGLIITLIASTLFGIVYGLFKAWRKYRLKTDAVNELKIYITSTLAIIPALIIHPFNLPALTKIFLESTLYLTAYLTLAPLTGVINEFDTTNLYQILKRIKIIAVIVKPILNYEAFILSLLKTKNILKSKGV